MISHSKPTINPKDLKALQSVFVTGQVSQGKQVASFENDFAKFHKVSDSVALSSCTSGLHLGLIALGIEKNDSVMMPSYVCTALLNAVNYVQAKPIIVDVNYEDNNISIADVKRKLNKKVKAIIIPHMFGCPVDLDPFLKLGVPIIEDCAQSIGATYKGKLVGTMGVLGVYSFYATKVMTTGEGGMVISKSKVLLNKIRDLREYDHIKEYKLRFNYKMTDLQAALGVRQLEQLPGFINSRRKIAAQYQAAVANNVSLFNPDHVGQIFYRFVLKVKNKSKFLQFFHRHGVIAAEPVFKPIHQYLGMKGFVKTERVFNENISLPIYPLLNHPQVQKITRLLKQFLKT